MKRGGGQVANLPLQGWALTGPHKRIVEVHGPLSSVCAGQGALVAIPGDFDGLDGLPGPGVGRIVHG